MAKTVRLRFNQRKAFRELRSAPGVQQDLAERAARIAAAAGQGVEVLPAQTPRERAHLIVAPVTEDAVRRVAKDNALIRAMEAGRG